MKIFSPLSESPDVAVEASVLLFPFVTAIKFAYFFSFVVDSHIHAEIVSRTTVTAGRANSLYCSNYNVLFYIEMLYT